MGVKFVGLSANDAVAVIALYPEASQDEESATVDPGAEAVSAPEATPKEDDGE